MADILPEELTASLEARYKEGNFQLQFFCADSFFNPDANMLARSFLYNKIRETVRDPVVAEALCPKYAFQSKRPPGGNNFYESFNRPNVTLVNLNGSSIEALAPAGIVALGETTPVDDVILATGFDNTTGAFSALSISGTDGQQLKDLWTEGPKTYLGLGTVGFPNLFMITGPQSPGVLTNVIAAIEHHVDWIGDCMKWMQSNSKSVIEATADAQKAWGEHVNKVAEKTVFNSSSVSAYRGHNIPGKANAMLVYPGGLLRYRNKCSKVAANSYEGFQFK